MPADYVFKTEIDFLDVNQVYDKVAQYLFENSSRMDNLIVQKTLEGYEIHFWGELLSDDVDVDRFLNRLIYV